MSQRLAGDSMTNYAMRAKISQTGFLRLPLEGHLDLTYRCNNTCRHCWLWLAPNAREQADELSFDEIRAMVGQARALGTRKWSISGGEPMLRDDFPDIFDYLTRKSIGYSLNSNGTRITPAIAQLLKRKGTKMIALYGATAEVYDSVTRNPGGFDAALRGMNYLREAGAGFIVQLIPMRANWHQWDAMQELARKLSPHQRVGAAWLYLSSSGTPAKNREIAGQRLSPREVIELDKPDPAYYERMEETKDEGGTLRVKDEKNSSFIPHPSSFDFDDRLFAACIARHNEFHIDAYGRMTWCSFIKDPALRYDLRRGTFREAWEEFIPACADKVRGGDEWRANCGACEKRTDCRWCAVYAYLETGRYSARVPYLCAVADEAQKFKAEWQTQHRRYFQIAGITVRIESEVNFDEIKFKDEFAPFAVAGPGEDNVTLRHYFELPDLKDQDLGTELYRKAPWAISRAKNGTWFYRGISPAHTVGAGSSRPAVEGEETSPLHRVAVFNPDHTHGTIYSPPRDLELVRKNGWHSLSLFPTDQIWLAPLLADRNAVLMHSAAAIVNGQGLVFVGHSSAGKSTTMEFLKAARGRDTGRQVDRETGKQGNGRELEVEILCDDRNVLRKWDANAIRNRQFPTSNFQPPTSNHWRVHGTWSHGTTADVSGASAPLRAILFLEQDARNEIAPLADHKEIWKRLLATLIRSAVTAEWWQKELDVLEQIVKEVRCYTMKFDKSGKIVSELVKLTNDG
jgi:MoaA/NifB/PqqE/SkfB family radical SAM enzyme